MRRTKRINERAGERKKFDELESMCGISQEKRQSRILPKIKITQKLFGCGYDHYNLKLMLNYHSDQCINDASIIIN